MIIRQANPGDNTALIELTTLSPMNGHISLCTSRGNNFFGLTAERKDCLTYVAEDKGRLAGSFSIAYTQAYKGGVPHEIGYLCDLKIHPRLRGGRAALTMIRHAIRNNTRTTLYWAVHIAGNTSVVPFMKGRAGLPLAYPLGRFHVCELFPLRRPPSGTEIRYASPSDSHHITQLLRQHYTQYELAPCYTETDIIGLIREPGKTCQVWVAEKDKALVAVLILSNVNQFKVNILTGLPTGLAVATRLSNSIARILPVPRFPQKGEPVKMLYIKALAGVARAEPSMKALIRYARYLTTASGCFFLCAAFHEKDPLLKLVKYMPRFTFYSEGHVLDLNHDQVTVEQIISGIPYVDFSLI